MRKQILSFLMAVMMIFTIIPSLGLEIAAANAPAKLTNPSITPIEQSANKYVGYYDDEVSNSSKLTVKWRDVGQEYFNVAVKLLNGEPLTSSNEDGKYFYSLIREYQSNSITISASQMKEAAGKWVKVYIQSHFADGTETECHYYFKVSGAKFSRKPTLSLSVSGNELDTGVYGMYNPGETVYFNCTANYSDHIFVQTSSDDLSFKNPEGYVGKSGTFIEESSPSTSPYRSYENGKEKQIYIKIAEDAEPGDYTITVTATDGVYDPNTFSSIPGTSYYSSVKKSVTVRVEEKAIESSGKKSFASFSEAEKMVSYLYSSNWSKVGVINYVEQYWSGGNDAYYYTDANADDNGRVSGYWTNNTQAKGRCTRAASSMALSYMGLTALPKYFNPTNGPYKKYAESLGCVTSGNDLETTGTKYSISLSEFEAWYERYENDDTGKYSPIVLHTEYEGGMHAFAVFGRDSNNGNYYYVVDSGTGNHIAKVKIVEVNGCIRISEYKYANGNTVAKYNDTCEMLGVWQYIKDDSLWQNPFTDISTTDYYYNAVRFLYENGITAGTSATTFSPESTCTRAEVVTFLWRAAGCPEPKSVRNPFKDVKSSDWFFKPVLWAVEQNITQGTSATTFTPERKCSTAEILTFLFRSVGAGTNGYYEEAANWAEGRGLLENTGLKVNPETPCPRKAIAMYLYRIEQ